jgi:hypothetical protein
LPGMATVAIIGPMPFNSSWHFKLNFGQAFRKWSNAAFTSCVQAPFATRFQALFPFWGEDTKVLKLSGSFR